MLDIDEAIVISLVMGIHNALALGVLFSFIDVESVSTACLTPGICKTFEHIPEYALSAAFSGSQELHFTKKELYTAQP
eukprot:1016906-Pelagomonas_calceolata.AAC.3